MSASLHDIDYVLKKLHWMRQQHVWPNGLRYLWTDAFGLVLLISLYRDLSEQKYIDDAEKLVRDINRVLGRPRGIRIGESPDRDGQYFHYLAMWLFALARLGEHIPQYRSRAIAVARDVHRAFVDPRRGVIWKMKEDLTGPYPGFGYGALDAFNGYVVYRILGEQALASEITEMRELIRSRTSWRAPPIFPERSCERCKQASTACPFKGQMDRCRAFPQALSLEMGLSPSTHRTRRIR